MYAYPYLWRHSHIRPVWQVLSGWCTWRGSNPRPAILETARSTTELQVLLAWLRSVAERDANCTKFCRPQNQHFSGSLPRIVEEVHRSLRRAVSVGLMCRELQDPADGISREAGEFYVTAVAEDWCSRADIQICGVTDITLKTSFEQFSARGALPKAFGQRTTGMRKCRCR